MVGKRKASEDGPATTGRESKKQRTFTARTIETQSGIGAKSKSLGGLPTSIDVEKFAEARAFEIKAMEHTMKAARASATQRVWQTLPRHLRRRAASHDFRRVPLRLRTKAKHELEGVKYKPSKPKSKLGKIRMTSRTEELLRRQRDKSWLETHIWHAKRMKMANMWGYRLALHPNEKAFRPSYRAAVHGCIIHDVSFFSLIEICGRQNTLKRILEMCCDPMGLGPAAARYSSGAREYDTHIYACREYPFHLIGPATILWRPDVETTTKPDPVKISERRQNVKKGTSLSTRKPSSPAATRTVWIRTHPAIFELVQEALQTATALTLDDLAHESGVNGAEETIHLNDLRQEVNVFDLIGPKSTAVLQGVLNLVHGENSPESVDTWNRLREVSSAGSIPRGMVLALITHDPRLSFPPIIRGPTTTASESFNIFTPSGSLASSDIWSQEVRDKLRVKKYKKSELDKRRKEQIIPGTRLKPQHTDNKIPIILIQHTVDTSTNTNSKSNIHGWRLMVPAGWAMPFFSSLVFTGSRVGGLREARVRQFECGSARAFPEDYVTTSTFRDFIRQKAETEKARWARTPPAKKVSYQALEASGFQVPDVWIPDWSRLGEGSLQPTDAPSLSDQSHMIPTQPPAEFMDVDASVTKPEDTNVPLDGLWLLRGSDTMSIIHSLKDLDPEKRPTALLNLIANLRRKRGNSDDVNLSAAVVFQSVMVAVNVNVISRGSPKDLAILYAPTGEDLSWHSQTEVSDEDEQVSSNRAPCGDIVGYVTSGNYSLSRGRGHGIGTVSLACYFRLLEQAEGSTEPVVLVRNRDETVCRLASLAVLT